MANLLELYVKLGGLVLLGFILGRKLPATVPNHLGKLLFWVGTPISIVSFLRQADLSGQIWIARAIAHLAILLGAFLAWLGIKVQAYFTNTISPPPTQGSLILAAMVGNTGYLGFPITLAMVGKEYFAWALFYDMLGSLFGAYGLGVGLAAIYGNSIQNFSHILRAVFINPALWSFGFGLLFRQITIPDLMASCLYIMGWIAVSLSLILIGMRLSWLNSWSKVPEAGFSVVIKMVMVPLLLGSILHFFGITGDRALVVVLQMGMPPAFATLVIAETFNLDRDLAVTALAMGILVLLVTIPVWLWLF